MVATDNHNVIPLEQALDAERRARVQAERTLDEKNRELASALSILEHQYAEMTSKNTELEATIAQLESAHDQLVQSEKMASLGQLAAGIAHEINNPVGFVLSNLHTLMEYNHFLRELISNYQLCVAENDVERRNLTLAHIEQRKQQEDYEFICNDIDCLMGESVNGLDRVRDIVAGLTSFARQNDDHLETMDLNDCLQATLKIAWNQIKYNCELHEDYGELPTLQGNPGKLQQVFVNLLVNAAQAISQKGHIYIVTRHEGDYVVVRIRDTGRGIDPEHLNQIFNPFFTTKPMGQGTGLGLAISYGIIQHHGGDIRVTSTPGRGTIFSVYLPCAKTGCDQA